MNSILAERPLKLISKDGLATDIAIQIGVPYWVEKDVEAACPVAIRGMMEDLQDMHGVDFLQVLELAIGLANQMLLHQKNTEYRVCWPDGEPYDSEEVGPMAQQGVRVDRLKRG